MTDNDIIIAGLNALKEKINQSCQFFQGDDKAELLLLKNRVDEMINEYTAKGAAI